MCTFGTIFIETIYGTTASTNRNNNHSVCIIDISGDGVFSLSLCVLLCLAMYMFQVLDLFCSPMRGALLLMMVVAVDPLIICLCSSSTQYKNRFSVKTNERT